MKSEWKVTSNIIGGQIIYQVYRKLNEEDTDHSGNREYKLGMYTRKKEAEVVADKYNAEEERVEGSRVSAPPESSEEVEA